MESLEVMVTFCVILTVVVASFRASEGDERSDCNLLSDKKRAAVIYRMGQKRLVRGFLQEAEMALEVCLDYVSSD